MPMVRKVVGFVVGASALAVALHFIFSAFYEDAVDVDQIWSILNVFMGVWGACSGGRLVSSQACLGRARRGWNYPRVSGSQPRILRCGFPVHMVLLELVRRPDGSRWRPAGNPPELLGLH